jgi:2-dehydropantoate 2-reductase
VLTGGFGNAELALNPIGRVHIQECMKEIQDTAQAVFKKPFPKHFASIEAILQSTERNVGAKPSMLLDWDSQKPMEIEAILGNAIQMAEERGIKMPRLETMYHLLRLKQQRRSKL